MRGFINMLFLAVALSSACFLCSAFKVFGDTLTYPMGSAADMLTLNNLFQLTPFTALMGVGGAAAVTIIGILTRSGTYALYAVLIFGIGAFFPILQHFVLAVPNTIYAILTVTGLGADIVNPLVTTVGLWALVWGALYMFGIVFQRDMHT